jgi:hypothetical protein
MTHMKTIISHRTDATACHHAFGFLDSAGREIGMVALCWEVDVVEATDESGLHYTSFEAPGHYFAASVQSTRDGQSGGAAQPNHYFKTAEDRDAYLERRRLDSQKAAEKKGTPRPYRFRLSINVEM